MRKLLPCLILQLLATASGLQCQNPYVQTYTSQNGLPSNTVYYIYQDSRKFIWFATDNGISRYDGTVFINYGTKAGLDNNEVMRIKEDSFGRVWFFNLNGTLNYFFQNKVFNKTNAPFLDSLKSTKFFRDFFEDDDKKLYFYNNRSASVSALDTGNHVRKFDLDMNIKVRWRVRPYTKLQTRYISKDIDGRILFSTDIGIFTASSFFNKPMITLVTDTLRIVDAYPGRDRSIYMLLSLSKDSTTILKPEAETALLKVTGEIPEERIILPFMSNLKYTSVLEDNEGLLWVATFDKGVFCLKNNLVIRHYDIREAQSIIEDHENNIWISSMKEGVFKISPSMKFQTNSDNIFFENQGITALCPNYPHGIWCTDGKRIYRLMKNSCYALDFTNEKNPLDQLYCLNNDQLIAGAKSLQFYFFKHLVPDVPTKTISGKDPINTAYWFKTIAANRAGRLISAFGQSTILTFRKDCLFHVVKEMDIGERIYNIFYNLNDDLVVNAGKNYIFRDGKLLPCPELSRFDNAIITDHLILDSSTELFQISGDSIYLYHGNKMANLTAALGYPSDVRIRKVVYDAPTLYLSTFRNIYRCDNPLNILEGKPVQLQFIDINFRNIHDILVRDDSLFIASDDGLMILPETKLRNIKPGKVVPYFISILVNDREADPESREVRLTGANRVAFTFSCINYSSSPTLYSYKMTGLDSTWTTVTSRTVIYQNLSRGNYVFLLRACKPTEAWSVPVECRIVIKATFWQHPLTYLMLSVMVVALLVIFIIRRKNNQLKHQETDHQLILLEQKALQSMMNPHFIFNSLGSIQNFLLQQKSGEAALYLSQFARLIRQNLNSVKEAMINLDEETDRLKNYLDLERLRMEDKFECRIDVDENIDADEILIPSMIIQPFVENSIWHGLSSFDSKGLVTICFSLHNEKSLRVIIEDNGIGIKKAQTFQMKGEQHLNLGMEMTRKRLELLGRKYVVKTWIEFSEAFPGNPNPGTKVVMILPFVYFDSGR